MTHSKSQLEAKLLSLMNIDEPPGPPRFISETTSRELWIADTLDAAAIKSEALEDSYGLVVAPKRRARAHGLTHIVVGFGLAAGLALVIGIVFGPDRPEKNGDTAISPAAVAEMVPEKKEPNNDKNKGPSESPKRDLDLTVVVSDQGFNFEINPDIRAPWIANSPTPTVPEYAVPHIPKKDNDWDYAELERRLNELKDVHREETYITLEVENNIPYEILTEVLDSSRTASGEPLFPDVMLKLVEGWDTSLTINIVGVHYPRQIQQLGDSSKDLNLTVLISDQGFHFKTNPNFLMPWMVQGTSRTGPDIPKKGNDWDYAELRQRLRELKDNHRLETSIFIGAENHIPYEILFRTIRDSIGTSDEPLFPHVTLCRVFE